MQGLSALLLRNRPEPQIAPDRPPYINQRKPMGAPRGFDGSASCGPACIAMFARWIGALRELSDYQLIVRFSGIGKTSFETGTDPEGIAAMIRSLGKRPVVHPGSDLAFMRRSLARGAPVIVNGEYYAMPPHEDPSQREGHWILVYGIALGGDFLVHDSEDPAVRTVSPAAMERYLREHERGGFQVSINSIGR